MLIRLMLQPRFIALSLVILVSLRSTLYFPSPAVMQKIDSPVTVINLSTLEFSNRLKHRLMASSKFVFSDLLSWLGLSWDS